MIYPESQPTKVSSKSLESSLKRGSLVSRALAYFPAPGACWNSNFLAGLWCRHEGLCRNREVWLHVGDADGWAHLHPRQLLCMEPLKHHLFQGVQPVHFSVPFGLRVRQTWRISGWLHFGPMLLASVFTANSFKEYHTHNMWNSLLQSLCEALGKL